MDLQKEIEDLKVKSGYSGKPQQWQYGFDLACRELAKAQAVPDGFILVPTELLKDINNIAVNEFHKWKIREQNMPEICEYMQDLSYYIGIQK